MRIAALCVHMHLFVEAAALKMLHPTSRQAIGSYDYRRKQIAFSFPSVSIHRMEAIAREHAAARIEKGHGCAIRRAKKLAWERSMRGAVNEMLAAVGVMGGA